MLFLSANIDRAIVMAQFDIRGFWHALGFRVKEQTPKNLDAITCNFVATMAGLGDKEPTDESFVDYFDETKSFEDYLAMCKQLAAGSDLTQKEAVQLIVADLVKMNEQFHAEVAEGTREANHYLLPLEKGNRWGRTILALQEAFTPPPKKAAA